MSADYISQIIHYIGPALSPLGGVALGGFITYWMQSGLAKRNDIRVVYSKLFWLKKLIKLLYISRSHAYTLQTYNLNLPRYNNQLMFNEKEDDKLASRIERLDFEIAQTEAQISEICGKALMHTKNKDDKEKIYKLLSHPNLNNIEEAFTTVGDDVSTEIQLKTWREERKKEGSQNIEKTINECFLPVEELNLFKF